MPTRIDIDEALLIRIQALAKARGVSFRELARELLHKGLEAEETKLAFPARYMLKTYDFGKNIENPWAILGNLETEECLATLAKK